eukprot:SM000207S06172  [mRNA]  locus=s207:216019:216362:+ [translate_table: standard]
MQLSDRAAGLALLLASCAAFAYYSAWTLLTPFVEAGHPLQAYFPRREYAIAIPALAGVLLLSLVAIYVGVVILAARRPKAKAKAS